MTPPIPGELFVNRPRKLIWDLDATGDAELNRIRRDLRLLCWSDGAGIDVSERSIQRLLFKQMDACERIRATIIEEDLPEIYPSICDGMEVR